MKIWGILVTGIIIWSGLEARDLGVNIAHYNMIERDSTPHQGGPDGFGYTFVDSDSPYGSDFSWIDARGGNEYHLSDDDNVQVQIPFPFPFYEDTITSIYVVSNGFLSTDNTRRYRNSNLPDSSLSNLIAPFWDDLNPSQGGAIYTYYDSINTAFVVEWYQVPHYSHGGPYTFEVVLYPNGNITMQILDVDESLSNSSTIGIQSNRGDDDYYLLYTLNGNPFIPHDSLRIDFQRPEAWGNVLHIVSEEGIPGSNVTVSVELINREAVSAIQSEVVYDTTKLHLINISINDSIGNFQLSTNTVGDTILFVVASLTGDSILPGVDTLLYLDFQIDSSITMGDSTYLELMNTMFASPNGDLLTITQEGSGWIYFRGVKGDLNGDKIVNIVDVVRIVNIILGKPPSPNVYETWAADINDDGIINVSDAVGAINIIIRR